MTSVLEKLRKISDLRRLRAAVKRDPTPAAFADLAERYISLGKARDARKAATSGLAVFPTSERLTAISTFLRKDNLKAEITHLKKQTGENPSPAVFIRLAQCYQELGDHERTLAICNECSSRYPLNEHPYLVAGEMHTQRFFQHLSGNDGIEGEALLRRALRLNGQNLDARLLLAQIYYSIGALDYLDQELAEIRRLSADFEDLMVFRSANREPAEAEAEESSTPSPSMVERIRLIESRGEFVNPPWEFPSSALTTPAGIIRTGAQVDEKRVSQNVVDLANHDGVTGVAAIGPDGTTLAAAEDSTASAIDDFPVLVAEILSTACDATRRMEFGELDWCMLEGEFGGIAINHLKEISLAAAFKRPLKSGSARRLVGEFAARSCSADGEG